ncbi:MAG: oxidoreductase [Hydrocarboniphaga sp.]|uniref:SDR family NAD(P)-dependent oxidoreductase n=1 Tax=Hydrocarboniphaga sp. TaxID=2033016 RepID=UPI00262FD8D0|nr:SDR family NAD(P)-dependent oxidoreductase [Hydrocarboniphaga sp.]MDB5971656.1 oxidoreductase [Hydrocarboniphaga sp.]
MSNALLEELFSLNGKTAVVTGGAKGLGAMISIALAGAGARIIVVSRTPARPADIGAGLSEANCCCITADLSDIGDLRSAAAQITELAPKLDILVNNAGAFSAGDITSVDPQRWDSEMALNVRAPFFLVQNLMPQLKAAAKDGDPARVLNIGSIAALWPKSSGAYAYGASKAALHQLTRTLASDLTSSGIHVNAIAPGFFPTDMSAGLFDANPGSKEATIAMVPARRLGAASDIGGMAIALCSRAGAYLSGAIVPLEGGLWSA